MPLLARFQQIVELQESARLIMDLGAAQRPDHHYRDLKVGPELSASQLTVWHPRLSA